MALTEREAKVLGILCPLEPTEALTASEIRAQSGLAHTTTIRALARLERGGFAHRNYRSPAAWRATDRGRLVARAAVYQEYSTEGA